MRMITVKYASECRKCGAEIPTGTSAVYERRIGLFCSPCAPTDPEEIRAYRQEAANRKADRLDGWANTRRAKAAALDAQNAPYRGDIAFATQPGHIPERARAIARTERAWEHTKTAQGFVDRAERIRRGVRVAGDADKRDQAKREANDARLAVGNRIYDHAFGYGTIVGVFKKSYRITWERSGTTWARDKIFAQPAEPMAL